MKNPELITANRKAYSWIQDADELYIAIRLLLWKGFAKEFYLFGAHVMELYLKAYLIHMTGKYPVIHDLDTIYEICMGYDSFFSDNDLIADMIAPDTKTWPRHMDVLRYPEPIGNKKKKYRGTGWIMGIGGSHKTLDRIAYYVRETVPRSENSIDIIREFLNGSEWWLAQSNRKREDWLEIRECFLIDNLKFTTFNRLIS